MGKALGFSCTLVAALALGAACTVHQSAGPTLTGPSELAQSLRGHRVARQHQPGRRVDGQIDGRRDSVATGRQRPNGASALGWRRPTRRGVLVLQDFGTLSAADGPDGSRRHRDGSVHRAAAPPTPRPGPSTRL